MAARLDGMTGQSLHLEDVAVVIAHHRSYASVAETVRRLVGEEIAPRRWYDEALRRTSSRAREIGFRPEPVGT
jgi:hypothetical protein